MTKRFIDVDAAVQRQAVNRHRRWFREASVGKRTPDARTQGVQLKTTHTINLPWQRGRAMTKWGQGDGLLPHARRH